MAKAKKKLLPKNFEELLKQGDLAKLKKVFEDCELDARGGYAKQTALAFADCPDELARWLVAQGADLSAADTWGNTPLHSRARSPKDRIAVLLELGADVHGVNGSKDTPLHVAASSAAVENVALLLERGAKVDALNGPGFTPLESALSYQPPLFRLGDVLRVAEMLLAAGAVSTPRIKETVAAIGKDFEFRRSDINPEHIDAASAGLERLYAIFDVPPAPRRILHDGAAPIIVQSTDWRDQHQELWELLVPTKGHAATVQGEVIRISGRIQDELYRNGGMNWDADYKKMADAFLAHVRSGNPLSPSDLADAAAVVAEAKRKIDDESGRMCELAVAWVLANPMPVKLPKPPYER